MSPELAPPPRLDSPETSPPPPRLACSVPPSDSVKDSGPRLEATTSRAVRPVAWPGRSDMMLIMPAGRREPVAAVLEPGQALEHVGRRVVARPQPRPGGRDAV